MNVFAACAPSANSLTITTLLLILAPVVNLYPFFYFFRPWYSTPQGRALMIKAISNAILIDMGVTFTLFGDYPGRDAIRVVGFSLLVIGIWYLFLSLMTAPGAKRYPPWSWLRCRR